MNVDRSGMLESSMTAHENLSFRRALNDIDQVRILLENGEDPNGPIRPSTGVPSNYFSMLHSRITPLCQYPIEAACSSGCLDIIKLLLSYGATLKKRNCLHAAAGGRGANDPKDQIKVLEFLFHKELDINKVEFQDDPDFPLRYASRPYGTPLHYAVTWGYEDRFELLLRAGADPNVLAWDYVLKEECGTVLDWQMNEGEGGEGYSPRIRELLGVKVQAA